MDQFMNHFEALNHSWWPYIISTVVCVLGAIRFYIRGEPCPSHERIDGKTVIITGASGGIGLSTAKELAGRGANVILAVRNAEKGKKALDEIKTLHPGTNVIIKLVDVADFANVREFANQIALEYDKIDILINNAGVIFHPYKRTIDGNETTMTTNYFGVFLLTHLLLPLLNKSEQGRVINISAVAHQRGKIELDNLNSEKGYSNEIFANSKLALTMFSKKMAALFKDTNVVFLAVDPGLVRGTGHLRHSKLMTSMLTKMSVFPWMWLFMKTPRQGSQTVVFAAVEPSLKSGTYLRNCEIEEPSEHVLDTELSTKLYEKTCEIVNINSDEIMKKLSSITAGGEELTGQETSPPPPPTPPELTSEQ